MLWIAAIAAFCALPLGSLLGGVLSAGQDGPGSALARVFGSYASIAVWAVATAVIIWNPGGGLARLSKGARTVIVLSILVLPATAIVSAANRQEYDVRVWNRSGSKIDDVVVRMAGKNYIFGVLSDGISATISFQTTRPEGNATIEWIGESGSENTAEVDVSELVPRRYHNGVLTFTFHPGNTVTGNFFIRKKMGFE